MDVTVLGLITVGVLGIFYVVFAWGSSKKVESNHKNNDSHKNKKGNDVKAEAKKNTAEIKRKDMLNFIEFDKISDDMILQDKETKYTMVIQCKGINYDLMSEVEQLSVEEGFITFLNTLKSPIQIYVQARAINLKTSLDMYKTKVDDINLRYLESADKFKRLSSDINTPDSELREAILQKEKFENISEYAQDITRYIEKLSLNKHMLQRKFYIVMSYYKSEVNATAHFSENEMHDICYRELYTRAQSIIGALQSCSVSAKILKSNELAELLYISYNRDDEKLLDIKTALDSGFYRMYSTSKDLQEKKREVMQKQIQEEAMNRVEQAIKVAINNGIIKTEDQMIEEYENATDLAAIKIIEDTNISDEEKKKIQQVIVDQHNQGIDERKKEREELVKGKAILEENNENKNKSDIIKQDDEIINNKVNVNSLQEDKTIDNNANVNPLQEDKIIDNNANVNPLQEDKIIDNNVDVNPLPEDKIINNNVNVNSSTNDKTNNNNNNNNSNTSSFDDLIV